MSDKLQFVVIFHEALYSPRQTEVLSDILSITRELLHESLRALCFSYRRPSVLFAARLSRGSNRA